MTGPGRTSRKGVWAGADCVAAGDDLVNLDTFSPEPSIDGKGSHGGYAGPAVKPLYLARADTDVHIEFPYKGQQQQPVETQEGGHHAKQS